MKYAAKAALLSASALLLALLSFPTFFLPWRSLAGSDYADFYQPYLEAMRRSLSEHWIPLWLPENYCGGYGLAEAGMAFLSPLHQMLRFMDSTAVLKVETFFFVVLLFAGMRTWLGLWLKNGEALLGAALSLLLLQIHTTLEWGHLTVLSGAAVFPWLLFVAHRLASSSTAHERTGWAALAAMLLAPLWILSHPQFVFIYTEACIAYLLFVFAGSGGRNLAASLLFFAAASGLGILGGLPQFHSSWEAFSGSGRELTRTDPFFLYSGSLWPGETLKWLAPGIFGTPGTGYWGKNDFFFGQFFCGPLSLALFLMGWRGLRPSMKFILVLGFLLSLGYYTPVYGWHGFLPGADIFRYPSRYLYALAPFVVLAVLLGWRRALEKGLPLWAWGLLAASLAATLLARLPAAAKLMPAAAATRWAQSSLDGKMLAVLAIEIAAAAALVSRASWMRRAAPFIWLAALVALNLVLPFGSVERPAQPDWPRNNGVPERVLVHDPRSFYNYGALSGCHSAVGYSDIIQNDYRILLDAFCEQDWRKQNRVQFYSVDPAVLSILDIRRVHEGLDASGRPAGNPGAAATAGRYFLARDFSPPPMRGQSSSAAAIKKAQDRLADGFRAFFRLPEGSLPSSGRVEVLSYGNEEIRLRANCDGPAILASSENSQPIWRAEVDGKEAEIRRWLGTFRCLFLPPGGHEVRFFVDRRPFNACLAVSGVTMILLIFAVVLCQTKRQSSNTSL